MSDEIEETQYRPTNRSNVPIPDPSDRTTLDLHREIGSLKELLEEKIKAINETLVLRRSDVNSALNEIRDAARAQQAATTAAILHSEAQTKEVFTGLNTLINSKTEGLDGKINLINGRLDKGEGLGSGHEKDRATTYATMSIAVAVASLIIGLGVAIFSIFGNHNTPAIEVSPPASVSAPASK